MKSRAVAVVGLVVAVALGIGLVAVWRRGAARPSPMVEQLTGVNRATQARDEQATWDAGPFTPVAGRNIRGDLDGAVVIETQEPWPENAETLLRAKAALFLRAFSTTDFEPYLEFRNAATFCDANDARVATARGMCQALAGPGGTAPTELVDILRRLWAVHYVQGMGPVQPGAPIEAVNWKSARLRVRALDKPSIVPAEWDEHAGAESHLYKEVMAAGRGALGCGVFQLAVPNRTSAAAVVTRDGRLVFADFEVVAKNRHEPPCPVLVRFYWAGADEGWLPLSACKLRNSPTKPFFW